MLIRHSAGIVASVLALAALVGGCGFGAVKRHVEAPKQDEEPAPRWESAGETAPPDPEVKAAESDDARIRGGGNQGSGRSGELQPDSDEGAPAIPAPAPRVARSSDEDRERAERERQRERQRPAAPASSGGAASSGGDVRALIAGKDLVFSRGRIRGNTKEGFRLQVLEGGGDSSKGQIDATLGGALSRGRAMSATLTYLQVPDNGPHSVGGRRALSACNGTGRLVLDSAPAVPRAALKEDKDVGDATGTLSLVVKCTGDARDVGTFRVDGRVTARVTLTPPMF